jgi:hypothetical protein
MSDATLRERVADLVRKQPRGWRRVSGGYTPAERWVVSFDDGPSCFVKAPTDDGTAAALRRECVVYSQLQEAFVPRMLGWKDQGATPVLVLEDLSEAAWPPPWTEAQIGSVLETIDLIRRTSLNGLPSIRDNQACLDWWPLVKQQPDDFLALGLSSRSWLENALPVLSAASVAAPFDGNDVVHFDVRSDNICFLGDRCILIDWNFACRGNGDVNIATWLPSLEAEGGPRPESILPDGGEFAAWMSGYWAWRAGQPPRPSGVRDLQLEQLLSALPWAIRELGLAPLDGERVS